MAQCPKCRRNSLEFSEGKSVAWCLYSECTFCAPVRDYSDYVEQYESKGFSEAELKMPEQSVMAGQ
jgi:hypothetical protein